MRTLLLLASIVWALNAPLPFLLKTYLRVFLFVTGVLEGMLLFPATNNYQPIYFYVYWTVILYVSVFQPLVIVYVSRGRMLHDPKRRILLAAWLLMAIYYAGYFRDWHSSRLDWVPSAIYTVAFIALGVVARSENPPPIPVPHASDVNT